MSLTLTSNYHSRQAKPAKGLHRLIAISPTVTHPHSALGHDVAAELLSEIGYIVKVEFRANEQLLRQEELHSDSCMHLEMGCRTDGLRNVGTNGSTHASGLRIRKAAPGATNPALKLQHYMSLTQRRNDGVEIIEGLPVLYRSVVALCGLQVDLRSNSEVPLQHHVSSEAEKESVQAGRLLTEAVSR